MAMEEEGPVEGEGDDDAAADADTALDPDGIPYWQINSIPTIPPHGELSGPCDLDAFRGMFLPTGLVLQKCEAPYFPSAAVGMVVRCRRAGRTLLARIVRIDTPPPGDKVTSLRLPGGAGRVVTNRVLWVGVRPPAPSGPLPGATFRISFAHLVRQPAAPSQVELDRFMSALRRADAPPLTQRAAVAARATWEFCRQHWGKVPPAPDIPRLLSVRAVELGDVMLGGVREYHRVREELLELRKRYEAASNDAVLTRLWKGMEARKYLLDKVDAAGPPPPPAASRAAAPTRLVTAAGGGGSAAAAAAAEERSGFERIPTLPKVYWAIDADPPPQAAAPAADGAPSGGSPSGAAPGASPRAGRRPAGGGAEAVVIADVAAALADAMRVVGNDAANLEVLASTGARILGGGDAGAAAEQGTRLGDVYTFAGGELL